MKEIREKINSIDEAILKLLAERRQLSVEIIKFKTEEKLSIRDLAREDEVICRVKEVAGKYELDEQLVEKIYSVILKDSILLQQNYFASINNKS